MSKVLKKLSARLKKIVLLKYLLFCKVEGSIVYSVVPSSAGLTLLIDRLSPRYELRRL